MSPNTSKIGIIHKDHLSWGDSNNSLPKIQKIEDVFTCLAGFSYISLLYLQYLTATVLLNWQMSQKWFSYFKLTPFI